jgi:hypothetical protein
MPHVDLPLTHLSQGRTQIPKYEPLHPIRYEPDLKYEATILHVAPTPELRPPQVDAANRELSRFQESQEVKFKGLQRLVAEFVVEKNTEMADLKRAVADLQTSSRDALMEVV